MADARRFIELGMVPPLAKELASQMNTGVMDKRRLIELSMVPRVATEVVSQFTTKNVEARRLAELGVPTRLASEISTQIAGGVLVSIAAGSLIAAEGDSTIAGISTGGGTSQVANSWPSQWETTLVARNINASAQNRFGCASALFTTMLAIDGRVTSTGGWSQTGNLSLGGNTFGTSVAGNLTFAPSRNVKTFDIYWINGAAGRSFTYSLDGAAAVTVPTTAAFNVQRTRVVAASSGAHSITLALGSTVANIIGIDAYDDSNTAPIRIHNYGISGANSAQVGDNSDATIGRLVGYRGFTFGAPALQIIEGGVINDWRQNVAVATSKANITTLVTNAKTAGSKVLLLTPVFDNDMTNNGPIQDQYVTAMKEIASEQNVPILDVRPVFQSWSYANSQGWMSDSVHPSAAGYAVIKNLVDAVVKIS